MAAWNEDIEQIKKAAQDSRPQQDERDRALDDFWDIGQLIPAKTLGQRRTPANSAAQRTEKPTPVDIEVPSAKSSAQPAASQAVASAPLAHNHTHIHTVDATLHAVSSAPHEAQPIPVAVGTGTLSGTSLGKPHYVPPHSEKEEAHAQPLLSYAPDGILLHRVDLYPWQSGYRYFDQFIDDAVRYNAMQPAPGKEPTREQFFSFFPQYAQLNRRQKAWYLYWRKNVRKGVYLDTDYGYILLYLFELINLPTDSETTEDRALHIRDMITDVWMAYRKAYSQLDHYMCEWLCDYCLIHRLNAPLDRLSGALNDIMQISQLKEFYLTAAFHGPENDLSCARMLLRYCCQYDYRKSKFATGEHAPLFDKTIPSAVAAVLPLLIGKDGQTPLIQLQDSTAVRDAFAGALCAYGNKRRIYISYTSFSRSNELRFLMGDMVKHVENRVRTWIGVRSKLSVMSLPPKIRDALDAYLAPLAPARPAAPTKKKATPRPDYEAQYDLPHKQISLSDADAIERDSWETTRILTEAFGGEAALELPAAPPEVKEITKAADSGIPPPPPAEEVPPQASDLPSRPSDALPTAGISLKDVLGTSLCDFVRLALTEDAAGQRAFAKACHTMPDALADSVNSMTVEHQIYDVILEDRGDGIYRVLEDYRDTVKAQVGE